LCIEHGRLAVVARLPHASRRRSHGVIDLVACRSDFRRGVGRSSRRRRVTRLQLQAKGAAVAGSPPGRQGTSQGVRTTAGVQMQTIGSQRRNSSRACARRNAPAVQRDRTVEVRQSTNAAIHHAEASEGPAARIKAAPQSPLSRVRVLASNYPEASVATGAAHE